MAWLLALVGAILGVLVSAGEFFGFVAGGLIGALWGRVNALNTQLRVLQEGQRSYRALRAAQTSASSPAPPTASAVAAPLPETEPREQVATAVESPVESVTITNISEPAAVAAEPDSAERPQDAKAPSPAATAPATDTWAVAGTGAENAPDLISRGLAWLRAWFSEGNVPVKIGMLVLFFGVAGLLKYASDQGLFSLPIEVRLSAIAAAALAALWFAWGRRESRRMFSLGLQGGALGVLLLTVFAAYRYYAVLPALPAFAMVLLVVAASGFFAVKQQAMGLAVLGSVGGFLAPVLLSTGSGNHVGLFSYYAVLNAAIFAIAWVRSWRLLNLIGFAFTFVIGLLWGERYYRPEHFASTEPFLVLFFLMYVGIGYLFATRQPQAKRGLVDGSLLFGTPLIAAGLQAALLRDNDLAMAGSALVAAAIYALLAWRTRTQSDLSTLSLSYASLALGFATIAVPLALDADVTAQVWALEGAAVLWLGLRQQRGLQVLAGAALQVFGLLAWLFALLSFDESAQRALLNGVFAGGVMLAAAWACSARLLEPHERFAPVAWMPLAGAIAIWLLVGAHEVEVFAQAAERRPAFVLWLLVTLLLSSLLRQRLRWPRLAWSAQSAILISAVIALSYWDEIVLQGWGTWVWPLYLLAAAWSLYALARPLARGLSWTHVAVLASVAMLAGAELHVRISGALGAAEAWNLLAALAPLGVLVYGSLGSRPWAAWPLREPFSQYRSRWLWPAATVLSLGWLHSLGHDGGAQPLPYLTLFNPLELLQLGILLLLFAVAAELQMERALRVSILAAAGFVWISVMTLRGVHHYAGIPWDAALAQSMLAQTSLTVVWSVLGVSAWILGSRRASRPIWLAGALLMGVVLAKLVLIDREHMGNIAGIVSFLAVGVLLTVVGYLAPSPPKAVGSEQG